MEAKWLSFLAGPPKGNEKGTPESILGGSDREKEGTKKNKPEKPAAETGLPPTARLPQVSDLEPNVAEEGQGAGHGQPADCLWKRKTQENVAVTPRI